MKSLYLLGITTLLLSACATPASLRSTPETPVTPDLAAPPAESDAAVITASALKADQPLARQAAVQAFIREW
ncbi:MAG: hypothetical protein HC889_09640 [Synechococcaceae cyanobacterium SM1_2_3]|nr:hypothetical protein [Synechococcaceae cyanobacterium SM1_2_3]